MSRLPTIDICGELLLQSDRSIFAYYSSVDGETTLERTNVTLNNALFEHNTLLACNAASASGEIRLPTDARGI
jgi:hypothetical protein